MKVRELIKHLETFDPELPVAVNEEQLAWELGKMHVKKMDLGEYPYVVIDLLSKKECT
jgi:hypothetical protein